VSTNVLTLSIVSGQVVVYYYGKYNTPGLRQQPDVSRPTNRGDCMLTLTAIIAYPPSFPQLNSCAASQNCEVR